MSEKALDVSFPDLQLAQPGRVDEDRPTFQDEELPVPGRVPPTAVTAEIAVGMRVRPASG